MNRKQIALSAAAVVLLAAFTAGGYRAGRHLTEMRYEKEKTENRKKEETEAQKQKEDPVKKTTEEETKSTKQSLKMEFADMEKYLAAHMEQAEIKHVQEEVKKHLQGSVFHPAITRAVCLPYVETGEGNLRFYLKLSDGALLLVLYEKEQKELQIQETGVTESLLKESARQKEEKEERERQAAEIFERPEGGAPAQETPEGTPTASPEPVQEGPYTFQGFETLTGYLGEAQAAEVKEWITGLVEASPYKKIQMVTLKKSSLNGHVLTIYAALDAAGVLEIRYDIAKGEAAMDFDTVALSEIDA